MPALNFQKQFAPKILSGAKRQTIRGARKYPIKVGDRLCLYTGMRTKNCMKIAESHCIKTHEIVIRRCTITEKTVVKIDGDELSAEMVAELAMADGFEDPENFLQFFFNSPKSSCMMAVKSFSGQIIKWGMLCQK